MGPAAPAAPSRIPAVVSMVLTMVTCGTVAVGLHRAAAEPYHPGEPLCAVADLAPIVALAGDVDASVEPATNPSVSCRVLFQDEDSTPVVGGGLTVTYFSSVVKAWAVQEGLSGDETALDLRDAGDWAQLKVDTKSCTTGLTARHGNVTIRLVLFGNARAAPRLCAHQQALAPAYEEVVRTLFARLD